MTLRSAILALLLCAAHAQARTLYVSTTGSHKYGSATDATTNANHGAALGVVTSAADSPFAGENGAAFDGTSGYVDIGADFNQRLNGAGAITLEAWVNPARTNRGSIVQGHTQLNGYYGWSLDAENGNVGIGGRSTGTETFGGYLYASAPTGTWTHAAGILDYASGELRLYVNGTLATNMSASWSRTNFLGTVPSLGSNIGAANVFNSQTRTNFILGSLSDIRIWNVARTPEQIAENYTNRLTGTEEGLVGYWPLDDGEDLYSFKTPATAATNIQAAIEASSSGDTVRVAPGTYFSDNGTNHIIAITNKSNLSVIGGNGTLFDADRTILDAGGSASARQISVEAASNRVAGFTAMNTKAQDAVLLYVSAVNCTLDSLIVRNNDMSGTKYGCGIKNMGGPGNEIRNCIVVGNGVGTDSWCAGIRNQTYLTGVGICRVANCVVEANTKHQLCGLSGTLTLANTIHGNVGGTIADTGGNLTSNTTNSVCRLLGIAPASEGVGTNLVWAGVSAYIPRLGSLARKNGQAYAGIETASDGAGGPSLVTSRQFLGRDVSTNRNYGLPVGGVTSAADSPFAGERSAAFDGASGYVDIGADFNQRLNGAGAITLEAWVNPARTNRGDIVQGHTQLNGYYGWVLFAENGNVGVGGRSTGTETFQGHLNSAAPTGAWTHAAGIIDYASGELRLYVNGTLATNMSASWSRTNFLGTVPSLGSNIGAGNVYNSQTREYFLLGSLSDVRIWNVARTPEQIAANYTNRLTGTEEGLVGYWPLTGPVINPVDSGPFNLDNPTIHPTYLEAF